MNINQNAPIESLLKAISEHLNARTKQAGLKKKDLAALAGVNQNTITAILAGGDLKVSTLIRLSRVLDDTQWLQLLIAPPQPTPLEQLRTTTRQKKSTQPAKKPGPRQMGRKQTKG